MGIDALFYEKRTQHHCGSKIEIAGMHWPWGAGMFATSLGPHDACFVIAANWRKGSGYKVLQGQLSAVQKEVIEASKINECRNGIRAIDLAFCPPYTSAPLWWGPVLGILSAIRHVRCDNHFLCSLTVCFVVRTDLWTNLHLLLVWSK